MILQALAQLYEDLAADWRIARPGWVSTKVHWALSIDENGTLLQVIPLLEQTDGKKPRPQQIDLPAPVKRSSGIAANFLCDNSGYMLGINPFNQPGVESYKKNMFALLGKPGYEEKSAELKARLGK